MEGNTFEEIKKYTKYEILEALKKTMHRPEILLEELPIVRYNTMCNKSLKVGEEACDALKDDNVKLFIELHNKSEKIWREANDFIDKSHKQLLQQCKDLKCK